jgi:hypothetical protein
MTRAERRILLNQVARSMQPFEAIQRELSGLSDDERLAWIDDLIVAVDQSHPTPQDVEASIVTSGMKPTFTPCVLLVTKPLRQALAAIRALPPNETEKAFRLMTALLGISDGHRRIACGSQCHHWWHKDLDDAGVVSALMASGEA